MTALGCIIFTNSRFKCFAIISTLDIFNNPYPIFEPDLELYNVQILYKPTSAEEIVVNVKNFISGERILN